MSRIDMMPKKKRRHGTTFREVYKILIALSIHTIFILGAIAFAGLLLLYSFKGHIY